MREVLARLKDQRITIRAWIQRYGSFNRINQQKFPTLLLRNVHLCDGTHLCDHCWIFMTKTLRDLALQPGDLLQCSARVRVYKKGYIGHTHYSDKPIGLDYSFEHLEACICLQRAPHTPQEPRYEHESG